MKKKLFIIAVVLALIGATAAAAGGALYTADGMQKIAVASGFTMLAWPTKIATATIVVLASTAPPRTNKM
jgi:chromate transport protein ChrA